MNKNIDNPVAFLFMLWMYFGCVVWNFIGVYYGFGCIVWYLCLIIGEDFR